VDTAIAVTVRAFRFTTSTRTSRCRAGSRIVAKFLAPTVGEVSNDGSSRSISRGRAISAMPTESQRCRL